MRPKILLSLFVLLAILPAAAQTRRIAITLVEDTKVAGMTLKPGEYEVEIDRTIATFYRDGQQVVQVSVHERTASRKFKENGYVEDGDTLKRLQLGGTTRTIFIDGLARKS